MRTTPSEAFYEARSEALHGLACFKALYKFTFSATGLALYKALKGCTRFAPYSLVRPGLQPGLRPGLKPSHRSLRPGYYARAFAQEPTIGILCPGACAQHTEPTLSTTSLYPGKQDTREEKQVRNLCVYSRPSDRAFHCVMNNW